jgi:hypothetical protein
MVVAGIVTVAVLLQITPVMTVMMSVEFQMVTALQRILLVLLSSLQAHQSYKQL